MRPLHPHSDPDSPYYSPCFTEEELFGKNKERLQKPGRLKPYKKPEPSLFDGLEESDDQA
ncbi:MAG: hypothetical protein C4547_15770 [Phycisphaerales bacterium]|nr:MAG: hypothetical protein C4547_15770 [Phycisphaerales bacterium]